MFDFGVQGYVETGADGIDDASFEGEDIGGGGMAVGVDYHEWLGRPQGGASFGHCLASGFVDEPCRGHLDGVVAYDEMRHTGVGIHGFDTFEMLLRDDWVLEETAGTASYGGVGEFGVAYGYYSAAHIGGCRVFADDRPQVGVVEPWRRSDCQPEVYVGYYEAVAHGVGLEYGVAVAELHHVVREYPVLTGGRFDSVDLHDMVAGFHAVGADILHRRCADSAGDARQVLQSPDAALCHVAAQVVHHHACRCGYGHTAVRLRVGNTAFGDARYEDCSLEVAGEQHIASGTKMFERPRKCIVGENATEFVKAVVIYDACCLCRNAERREIPYIGII